jgi:hypothetical protein
VIVDLFPRTTGRALATVVPDLHLVGSEIEASLDLSLV